MNSKVLFQDFVHQLSLDEHPDEVHAIAYLVLETMLGVDRTAIMMGRVITLSESDQKRLGEIIQRLNRHEPVQYILGEADFGGRRFVVNNAVLIPRPETEVLVSEVLKSWKRNEGKLRLLDIGTGSGCIPITLALALPQAEVMAVDISRDALEVAKENAARHSVKIEFFECDVLQQPLPFQHLDLIVSNPPYITVKEKAHMQQLVLAHEPHLALFVPDDDPLLFYRVIASKAWRSLNQNGVLAFEINEAYGKEVAALIRSTGFSSVEIVKDISGKDRVVKGVKPHAT